MYGILCKIVTKSCVVFVVAAAVFEQAYSVVLRGVPSAMSDDEHAGDGHMGPIQIPGDDGVLLARQRRCILEKTGVSAAVRYRKKNNKKCLSLSGDPNNLLKARKLALEAIAKNKQRKETEDEDDEKEDTSWTAIVQSTCAPLPPTVFLFR
jgi:hypothetical protein